MSKAIHVYSLQESATSLKEKAQLYLGFPVYFWVANVAQIELGEGLPEKLLAQGALFNERGELRWRSPNNELYEALLLTEEAIPGLKPIPGEWEAEEVALAFLQDLKSYHVAPSFAAYPVVGPSGRLKVKVYRQNGIPVFISLRGFVSREG